MDLTLGNITGYSNEINGVLTDNIKSETFKNNIENAVSSGEDKKLRKACNDFESYFIKMMFENMNKTTFTPEDSMFAKSNAQNIFESMLYEEYGNMIANSNNGLGLSDMLYKQLSRKKAYDPKEVVDELQSREDSTIDFEA